MKGRNAGVASRYAKGGKLFGFWDVCEDKVCSVYFISKTQKNVYSYFSRAFILIYSPCLMRSEFTHFQ